MHDPIEEFQRSQDDRRLLFVFVVIGLVASAWLALPLMLGLNAALAQPYHLFFWVPLVGSTLLGYAAVYARRRLAPAKAPADLRKR